MFLSPIGSVDLALLIVRVVFGLCVFLHGWGKVTQINLFVTHFSLPLPLAWAVAIIQTAGAVLLILGLTTVAVAIVLVIVHTIATWMLITVDKEPFLAPSRHSWSIGVLYTLIPLMFVMTGAGKFSLDAML